MMSGQTHYFITLQFSFVLLEEKIFFITSLIFTER